MHQLFDPDSWIMGILSEIADLMIVNVLWILTSIPIFTIGASTTALYAVAKTPGSKRYASSVVKNYFSAFRRNFRSATLTFLILLVPMALALCNIFLLLFGLLEGNLISYVICGLSAFLFVFIWDYVFPLIAKINCFFLERVFRRFIPADPESAETEV